MEIITNSAEDTIRLGKRLGRLLRKGDVVALSGELGSGKTTFAKGVAEGAGVTEGEEVNSPSFVLVKEYKGRTPIYHIDLYRLDNLQDLSTTGFEEYLEAPGIVIIEWAEKAKGLLSGEYLWIELSVEGESKRKIKIIAKGERYKGLINFLGLQTEAC